MVEGSEVEQDIFRPIKIVVIGDGAVGKTCLIKRYPNLLIRCSYVNDQFPEEYVPTVLDCYRTEVNVNARGIQL